MKITKQQPAIIFIMITLLMSLILSSIAFADNNEKPIIHGDPNEPSLTIHKKQLDPRDEWDDNSDGSEEGTGSGMLGQNTNGQPLPGVEFTLTQTHVFDPTIADGQLIEAKTTDANGEIVRENLEYRTYEIFETVAPDGDRMLTVPIEVTVGDEIGHPAITVNNPKAG